MPRIVLRHCFIIACCMLLLFPLFASFSPFLPPLLADHSLALAGRCSRAHHFFAAAGRDSPEGSVPPPGECFCLGSGMLLVAYHCDLTLTSVQMAHAVIQQAGEPISIFTARNAARHFHLGVPVAARVGLFETPQNVATAARSAQPSVGELERYWVHSLEGRFCSLANEALSAEVTPPGASRPLSTVKVPAREVRAASAWPTNPGLAVLFNRQLTLGQKVDRLEALKREAVVVASERKSLAKRNASAKRAVLEKRRAGQASRKSGAHGVAVVRGQPVPKRSPHTTGAAGRHARSPPPAASLALLVAPAAAAGKRA
jgi:hypothetical protein